MLRLLELHVIDPSVLLVCHQIGDWDDLGAEELKMNYRVLYESRRLLSAYSGVHKD